MHANCSHRMQKNCCSQFRRCCKMLRQNSILKPQEKLGCWSKIADWFYDFSAAVISIVDVVTDVSVFWKNNPNLPFLQKCFRTRPETPYLFLIRFFLPTQEKKLWITNWILDFFNQMLVTYEFYRDGHNTYFTVAVVIFVIAQVCFFLLENCEQNFQHIKKYNFIILFVVSIFVSILCCLCWWFTF